MTAVLEAQTSQLPATLQGALQGARAWARTYSLDFHAFTGTGSRVGNTQEIAGRRLTVAATAIESAIFEIVDRRGSRGRDGRSLRSLGLHRQRSDRRAEQVTLVRNLDIEVRTILADVVSRGGITALRQIKNYVLTGSFV